jgi:putative transposase
MHSGRPIPGYSLNQAGQKISDDKTKDWLMELIAGEEHIYGYKLLAESLRLQRKLIINNKKVYRLCKVLDILQPQRRKIVHYPRRLARNHSINGINQLWQLDIKYGYVAGYDQFFYIADMIDVFDRNIVGYSVGSTCDAKQVCSLVQRALAARLEPQQAKPIIRTDNGPQFISKLFGEMCEKETIMHERIPPKTPNMNAYIESFHANIERNLMRRESFDTFKEAYAAIHKYMEFYNNRRLHSSLKKRSPVTFLRGIKDGSIKAIDFIIAV